MAPDQKTRLKAIIGGSTGNLVEWFDWYRGGPGCLNRLAVWISGSPLVDHAAARSGWSKYTWSGVLVPRAECGRMLL